MDAVKEEIDRLVELNVLKPVQFSHWASPIVIVNKPDGKIRICGNFKRAANSQLKIEQYPIPRIEEFFHKLRKGKLFSKIDLSDAYLQLELDVSSKDFLTINTPYGLYQFQRLPFGIASASAIFQKLIDQLIAGLSKTGGYLDDIVVSGETAEEHLRNLELLFERLSEAGPKMSIFSARGGISGPSHK